jgi:hypothetical protein
MRMNNKFLSVFALMLVMLLGLSGCSTPKPAGLTDEQLTIVAENILQSINANDYQKFTQEQFAQLQTMLQKASGAFVSVGTPSLSNNQGYAVYRFSSKYANETVYVTITFLVGGQKVEGLFFDSANLRKANQ